MIRKIIVVAFLTGLIVGCISDQQQQKTYDNMTEGVVFSSNFSKENYVFGEFMFSKDNIKENNKLQTKTEDRE